MQTKPSVSDLAWRGLAAAALWVAADYAGLLLWLRNPPWVSHSFGRAMQIFELQSFTHLVALLGIGALLLPAVRRRLDLGWPLAAFLAWALFYQTLFQSFGRYSYDYSAWTNGMVSQLQFGNPYMGTENPIYWYPPALAEMLAFFHRCMEALFPTVAAIKGSHGQTIAHLTFYVFQCSQQALLMVLFWLSYAFCRDLKIPAKTAALASGFLLLCNVPLYRMLAFHQPNLWSANAFFIVLLFRKRSPVLTGLALAVGFHLKLYPAILGLPLLLAGCWRGLFWSGLFAAIILGFQIEWGQNLEVWTRFLARLADPPIGSFFRDNSLHGIAKNLLKPFGHTEYTGGLTFFFQIVAVGWLAGRIFRRERLYWQVRRDSPMITWLADYRFYEQFMDTVVLGLLLSPLVFEHHYAMAVPLVVWAWLTRGEVAPKRLLAGATLMLLLPIYDVVPLSWNRIAGLFVLMSARPVVFPAAWPEWPAVPFRRWLGEPDAASSTFP